MGEEEEAMVVCMSLSAMPNPPTAMQSKISYCADCGQEVWVAQSSRKLMETTKVTLLCIACAKPRFDAEEERPTISAAPGASEEFRRSIEQMGKLPTEELIQALKLMELTANDEGDQT